MGVDGSGDACPWLPGCLAQVGHQLRQLLGMRAISLHLLAPGLLLQLLQRLCVALVAPLQRLFLLLLPSHLLLMLFPLALLLIFLVLSLPLLLRPPLVRLSHA